MKQQAFNVWRKGQKVDTVFFDADMSEEDVKASLIVHNGYLSDIQVTKKDVQT